MDEQKNENYKMDPESLMKKIQELDSNNYFLIKEENLILDIFSYLQDKNLPISNKLIIIRYLTKCITNIPINAEILLRNKLKSKCLYHIIIYQYITNYENKEYYSELKNIFCVLLKNISLNSSLYKYLISFISNYINKKNLLLNDISNINIDQNYFKEEININEFNSDHLFAILELIYCFYDRGRKVEEPCNYFYFSGNPNNNIMINNDNKLINSINNIYILVFIKLIDLKYLEKFDKFSLLEIKLNNQKSININIIPNDINNNDNSISIPYSSFSTTQINQVLIKINKNSKLDIIINNNSVKASEIPLNKEKIETFTFFNNFIGYCTNIIIYKNYTTETLIPKFINNNLYKNGIYKEELFSGFIKAQIMNEIDEKNITDKYIINYKDSDLQEIKNFIEKNLISIYLPTRTQLSEENNNIYLKDCINGLDAILNIDSSFSGVHSLEETIKAFYSIGTINHLLPIIELVNKETTLANTKFFSIFMDIINYIFTNLSNLFHLFDKNTQFFYYLSHFLEKIPEELYCEELNKKLRLMSIVFLAFKDDITYQSLNQQFLEYILLNENILFKFSFELQKNIINQIIVLMNEKYKAKPLINIDIIKIIKILLYYDSQKYNKYCCKMHSDYFNDAEKKGIMSPELNSLIEPVINLIKELFNRFTSQFKNINNNIKSIINSNQQINDYNLDKLFDLLTFNISPCLQKTILTIFYNLKTKSKELYYLNKNGKFLHILLFLLKTTLFQDIKSIVYDFIILLYNDTSTNPNNNNLNGDNSNSNTNLNIRRYIENHFLPYYLLIDERGKSVKVANVSGEIDDDKFNQFFFINNIKYNYLVLSSQQLKLNNNLNKSKLEELINIMFEKIYNNFTVGIDAKMNLNILIKILSKGDVILSIKFLEKIKEEIVSKSRRYIEKYSEIYSNNNFFNWLLETSFHAYLLKDSNKKNLNNPYDYGFKYPSNTSKESKISYADKLLEKSIELIIDILNGNIFKLDYLITWSKYYYEIIEEENNYNIIRDYIYDLIFQKLIVSLKEIFQPNITSNKVQRTTLYFYNIIFEYYTYYRIKANQNQNDIKDEDTLYQEISTPFKYKILQELKKEVKDNFSENIYDILPKLPFYIFMKKVYKFFSSVWFDDKKKIKNDKDFYKTYIYHKQNIFANDLEFLFYSFSDINELQQNDDNIYIYGNKGIPLIYILFHQFTIFLTLVMDKKEFKEILENFRLLISLVIISSSTLTIYKGKVTSTNNPIKATGGVSIINWPNEEQYKNIQKNVHLFLFNCFYFFYYKIIEINTNIERYKENKEKLDNLLSHKKYIYDTICYFLRILVTILKERKKHEEDKKKHNFKMMFSAIKKMIVTKTEGVELSGPYLFMLEFYTKCFANNKNINAENFDLNNYILKNKTFMDDIPIYNIDEFKKETSIYYTKIYPSIEKCGNSFINDANIKNYLDEKIYEYQKILFPFLKFIFKRKELVHNIIPIYDNSLYCKYNYNSLCLLTNYFPDYPFDKNVINNVIKISDDLSEEIRFSQMKSYFENYDKITKYYKIKKRLFSFNGLWSKKEFFYNKNKYGLKYKIFNHLTEDYTKIFLTPIIDIDYYLPRFSSFNTKELFRPNKGNNISLTKVTDLSSESINNNNEEETQIEKFEVDQETDEVNEEKKEEDSLSLLIKDKLEDELNCLYLIKKINYKFIENLNEAEKNNRKHYLLFLRYVNKMNNINHSDFCTSEISCMIKTSFHIKGVFYNNYREIGFYAFDKIPFVSPEEYDEERKACFGSVFKTQKRKYDGYHFKIPYSQIAFVLKRRYFFKTIALEVFTIKNKSYLFKFDDKNIKKIYENIKHQMKSTIEDIQIEYSKIDSKIGFINNNDNSNLFINISMLMYKKKDMNLKNIYEKWATWEMSTFKFLMLINMYANRSLNDINQYPVFPWIITNYKENDYNSLLKDENLIRPFGVPMGMMDITEGAENRKNNFLEHWKSMEEDEEKTPNYDRYGTHYSTSLYVSYYLIRIFPFSNIRIELQGSKFDDPNRLFLTMENSFNMALTQKTDLRELIPEFFCFPEMFYNSNNLNLGQLTENIDGYIPEEKENIGDNPKKHIINNVQMPKWSKNNGYIFIQKHRELLESTEIGEKINEWINIIFGSKQKGPQAKKINNLFLDQTYDDFEEQHNKSSLEDKINQNRLVEFGVTPNQIFKNDVGKRKIYRELKNKNQLLYNTTESLKKAEEDKEFLNFEEIDCDFNDENPYKIFEFQKGGYKKWRVYILTKENIKIFTKKIEKIEMEGEKMENPETNQNKGIGNIYHNIKDIAANKLKIKDSTTKMSILKKDDIKMPNYKYRLNNYKDNYNCSVIYDKGAYMALGGFLNGNIIIKSLDYKSIAKGKEINKLSFIYTTYEFSPITKIVIDETETFAICANKLGTVFVFVINPEKKYVWLLSKILPYQKSEITALSISSNLNMFISCSKNGNCMLYSLPRVKMFNSWNIEVQNDENENNNLDNILCTIILIFHTPLPCFIFYIKNLNYLYVYSINGKFLKKHKLKYEIVNNGICKYIDYQFKDYLMIYNSIDKTIDIFRGIDFEFVAKSPIINYKFIDFVLSKSLDQVLILVENILNDKSNDADNKKSNIKYKVLVLKDKENQLMWK